MLLKYTLKNIFQKKGRLFIILFCMIIACFAAFMAADFGSAIDKVIESQVASSFGTADYLMIYGGREGVTDEYFAGLPEIKYVCKRDVNKREVTRNEKLYTYAVADSIKFTSFNNIDTAIEMKLIPENAVPEKGKVTINKKYSEKYGYEEGDTIILHDADEKEYSFVVSKVFSGKAQRRNEMYGYISSEDANEMAKTTTYSNAFIDVDNEMRADFEKALAAAHPGTSLNPLFTQGGTEDLMNQITSFFYLLFVMMFLLVVFVTVSFTEKIINERMSVIGTLRSIGVSMRKTAFILLFENVLYALIGGIVGLILYALARDVFIGVLSEGVPVDIGPINPVTIFLVFLGAILVQLLIPGLEMLKAIKTSIRDIIFDTRDSEYKLSYYRVTLGAVIIILGFIIGFTVNNLYTTLCSMILVVAGVALVMPIILKKVSDVLHRFFEKTGKPVAELAAIEAGSKKHNFGSAILAVASILVTSIVFIAGQSLLSAFSDPIYNCDVVVKDARLRASKYEFIKETEGVESIDMRYVKEAVTTDIGYGNGQKLGMTVMAMSDMNTYKGMGDLPSSLAYNEMIINQSAASKLGIGEGDSIKLVFHISEIFPMERELIVKTVSDKSEFMSSPTIIISTDLYMEIFTDEPSEIFIHTDDPDTVKEILEDNLANGEDVKTNEEIILENEESNQSLIYIILGVIIASVILSLVGISGNQVISFVARKKEYAMLHSCACPMGKIIRMIWIENGLVFGVAGIVAFIMSIPLSMLASKAFVLADLGIGLTVKPGSLLIYIIILWVITLMTSLTPIRGLKKMNTAAEMKYE
jgi:ABC-type transport system, involved in lipoprotein release, permease component